MAIKKRTNRIVDDSPVEEGEGKLVIVAKPKTPIIEPGVLDGLADPKEIRIVGAMGGDRGYTIADNVRVMRTVYDKNNPQEQRYRNRVRNRATAITAMCIVCQGGRKAVTECIDTQCPLWAFRFGGDPFYGNRT